MTKERMFGKLQKLSDNDNILLLTHDDLDGSGPAIILQLLYRNVHVKHCTNREMSQVIYNSIQNLEKYSAIVICDISCDEQTAEKVDKIFKSTACKIILLDHHKTAMTLNKYDWAVVSTEAPDDTARQNYYKYHELPDGYKPLASGTALLFDYITYIDGFNALEPYIVKNLLALTQQISAYDTWEWHDIFNNDEFNSKAAKQLNDLYWIYGMDRFEERMRKRMFKGLWGQILNENELDILDIEKDRTANLVLETAKNMREETLQIDCLQYRCVTCFATEHIGDILLYMRDRYPEADLCIVNYGTGISIRTANPDIDVAAIAAKHGGGGHKAASGFSIPVDTLRNFMNAAFTDTRV